MTQVEMILKEIEEEVKATRKCLENTPESSYKYKPHDKSMEMGYLALLVADIPKWITHMIEKGDIDFVTFEQFKLSNSQELLKHFDKNIEDVKKALQSVKDEDLQKDFSLKSNGHVLMTTPMLGSISSAVRHWVHHRGQLTVYLRLNNLPVPSIYGPSADDQSF